MLTIDITNVQVRIKNVKNPGKINKTLVNV